MDGKADVMKEFGRDLRSSSLEKLVPDVAARYQTEVIRFAAQQLASLNQMKEKIIVIEGRGYTLDYLPADLRVKLSADPSIRAERRWVQE
jgi:cytidylate kinase